MDDPDVTLMLFFSVSVKLDGEGIGHGLLGDGLLTPPAPSCLQVAAPPFTHPELFWHFTNPPSPNFGKSFARNFIPPLLEEKASRNKVTVAKDNKTPVKVALVLFNSVADFIEESDSASPFTIRYEGLIKLLIPKPMYSMDKTQLVANLLDTSRAHRT